MHPVTLMQHACDAIIMLHHISQF